MTLKVSASETDLYQWYRDGVPITGETNATCAVKVSGGYLCRAQNYLGFTFSDVVRITFLPPLPAINVTNFTVQGRQGTRWLYPAIHFTTLNLTNYQASNFIISATPIDGSFQPLTLTATNSPAFFGSLPVKDFIFSAKTQNVLQESPEGATLQVIVKNPNAPQKLVIKP